MLGKGSAEPQTDRPRPGVPPEYEYDAPTGQIPRPSSGTPGPVSRPGVRPPGGGLPKPAVSKAAKTPSPAARTLFAFVRRVLITTFFAVALGTLVFMTWQLKDAVPVGPLATLKQAIEWTVNWTPTGWMILIGGWMAYLGGRYLVFGTVRRQTTK